MAKNSIFRAGNKVRKKRQPSVTGTVQGTEYAKLRSAEHALPADYGHTGAAVWVVLDADGTEEWWLNGETELVPSS